LLLHYQPVIDSATGWVRSVEALVRWQHPEQGLVSPGIFIPIAEQSGLIVPIGDWVLRAACLQAVQWMNDAQPLAINVNVSTLQLAGDDYVTGVLSTLRETGLPPHMLELEVTESALAGDTQIIAQKLTELRDARVRVAIDDFGAGYSSLARVHDLPIDTLKLDRAFIHAITDNASPAPVHHRTAVVRSVATLAHSLGLKLVAEGVENESQARFLRRIGYDSLQGYLYSKPISASDIPRTIQRLGLKPLEDMSQASVNIYAAA
jgi:EAL domain-containing protein (putative c-di-GMP-specific phosphodiesterase class I)